MYIQEVRVTLLCENPDCSQQLEVWPLVRDTHQDFVGLSRQAVLDSAKRKRWLVKEGLVFCSDACEQASRNAGLKP